MTVAPAPVLADPVRAGLETQLDDGAATVFGTDACRCPDGSTTIVWAEGASSYDPDWFIRRIDATGAPLGPSTPLDHPGADALYSMELACDASCRTVVVWEAYGGSSPPIDGDTSAIYARRFDDAGVPLGAEFLVNTYTTGRQARPQVCTTAAGEFSVVWRSEPTSFGFDAYIRGRRFDATGAPLTGEVQVRDTPTKTNSNQTAPAVGCAGSGESVVVWAHRETFNTPIDLIGRRMDTGGVLIGTEFVVTAGPAFQRPIHEPGVTVAADGSFTVAWSRNADGGGTHDVFARRFDSSASPLGTEFVVNTYTTDDQTSARIAGAGDGTFVVVWHADAQEEVALETTPGGGIFGQRFDTSGAPAGTEFFVNSRRVGLQDHPSVALVDDDFWVVWASQPTDHAGVFGQRFCDPSDSGCDLCPGFDDSLDADADGVPDGCDPCTVLDASQETTTGRLSLWGQLDDNKKTVRFRGEFALPPGTSFLDVDALATGMRVLVRGSDAGNLLDATLPAGAYGGGGTAGWKMSAAGTSWTFLDRTGSPEQGVIKLVARDVGGVVRVKVIGKNGIYPFVPGDIPPEVIVVLGDQSDAAAGLCGVASFSPPTCTIAPQGKNVRCG
jgi:hypothetical protein